jgi:hypothetical protein
MRTLRATIATFATAVCVSLGWSAASFADVAWRVDALTDTTVVAGGQVKYLLQVMNVGTTASSFFGGATLNVALAPGLTVAPGGFVGWPFLGFGICSPADPPDGLNTFTCTLFGNVAPHRTVEVSPQLTLTADVPADASGVLTSHFAFGGGEAPTVSTAASTTVSANSPEFGVAAFDGQVASDAAGGPFTQAGGHPYSASTSIDFNTVTNTNPFIGPLWPVEATKDVSVDLPSGLIGNPTAAAQCAPSQLGGPGVLGGVTPRPLCPSASQVGTTLVRINVLGGLNVFGPVPVYNMVAPPNVPARFGFNIAGTVVTFSARVRSERGGYAVSIDSKNISQAIPIASTTVTLWGVPADSSHDNERGCPGENEPFEGASPGPTCTGGARVAFLRNPTSCEAPADGQVDDGLVTTANIDSWANPGRRNPDNTPDLTDPSWKSRSFISHLPPAYPEPPTAWGAHQLPTDCDKVPFNPSFEGAPQSSAQAGQPAGFTFDLGLPQSDDPDAVGQSDLRKAVVTLPAGVRVSPSSASGLGACSPAQIGLGSNGDASCPDSSKIGTLRIETPLLDDPLDGAVYLAAPHDNPFGSLLAIYLVAKGPGFTLKLAGKVQADPATGQLTATFDDQPQVPFDTLHLEFFGGPRAALVAPSQCGTYTTHAVMTSWSGKTVTRDASFGVSADGNGAPCPAAGFSPQLEAGTLNPVAGADSPFTLRLTRTDRDQEFSSLTVSTPTGLLGRIASTVPCPAGPADAGTCQEVSKIGTVTVGAGAGSNPFFITNGRAYITGPYKGARYGLSIVVPAVAGPFDLGNVIVRAAIFVDRQTAALKIVSNPLPTILEGIPLDVRDVRFAVDRPRFTINPTSCAEKRVAATVTSTAGAVAHPSDRFQAVECANLALAPKLQLTVGSKGHTRPGRSTPISTTLTQGKGQTNLRSVSVTLPGTLNALLPVINRACKLAEFQADKCGARARVGSAVAVTPLLRDPLRGSAYFVKNPARVLPDLMIALRGAVDLDLTGKVSIPGGKRLGTRFDTIPDAPISRFTLRLVAGRNSPLGIVTNLCSAKGRAATARVGFRGQNGAVRTVDQRVKVVGCPKRAR